jgi:SAM-dependent methyltransferase
MSRFLFTLKEVSKGKSVTRAFLNYRLSQDTLKGKTIDIGGGKNPDYLAFMKRQPGTQLVSFDIKTGATTDFEKDPLPAEDGSFDTVLFLNVMEHIFNHQHIAGEVVRIVRPQGQLIGFVPFLMWYHPDHRDFFRYTDEALERILSQAGAQQCVVEPIAHGPFTAALQMFGQLLPGFITAILFVIVYSLDSLYVKLKPIAKGRYALGYYFTVKR